MTSNTKLHDAYLVVINTWNEALEEVDRKIATDNLPSGLIPAYHKFLHDILTVARVYADTEMIETYEELFSNFLKRHPEYK